MHKRSGINAGGAGVVVGGRVVEATVAGTVQIGAIVVGAIVVGAVVGSAVEVGTWVVDVAASSSPQPPTTSTASTPAANSRVLFTFCPIDVRPRTRTVVGRLQLVVCVAGDYRAQAGDVDNTHAAQIEEVRSALGAHGLTLKGEELV